MLPETAAEAFDSPAHYFEVLWGGVRAIAFIEQGSTRLIDRYGREILDCYPELATLARHLHGSGHVLDGEIVALDESGRPQPSQLRKRLALDDSDTGHDDEAAPVTFQAFDVLYRDGTSVMNEPLRTRKSMLRQTVRQEGALVVPDYVEHEGVAFFEAARQHGLAGLIGKKKESRYRPGERSGDWLAFPVYRKDNFIVAGFTYGGPIRRKPRASGPFDSLLLGLFDRGERLRYVGEVTGGFEDDPNKSTLAQALDARTTSECPFAEPPAIGRLVFWCRPELVASVRYSQWTADGRLRFPLFEMLRPDVPPRSCLLPRKPTA